MTETTTLATRPSGSESAIISVVPTLALSLSEAQHRIRELEQFVRALMVEGVDYGKIPGAPKPTLLKPGAEKLCDIYGFTKLVCFVEPQTWEDREDGHAQYTCKVTLVSKRTGFTEAEGIGCCTTREKRFRSKDGKGYRDPWTERNAAQKMAKKRALVDAVLSATRTSGLFTQDIEDVDDALDQADTAYRSRPQARPAPRPTVPRPATRQVIDIDQEIGEVLDQELGIGQEDAADSLRPAEAPPVEADIPPAWRDVYDQRVVQARELNEAAKRILVVIPPYPKSRAEMQRQGQGLVVAMEAARRQLAEVR